MHDTAFCTGQLFLKLYGKENMTVLDIGGKILLIPYFFK